MQVNVHFVYMFQSNVIHFFLWYVIYLIVNIEITKYIVNCFLLITRFYPFDFHNFKLKWLNKAAVNNMFAIPKHVFLLVSFGYS